MDNILVGFSWNFNHFWNFYFGTFFFLIYKDVTVNTSRKETWTCIDRMFKQYTEK